LLKKVHLQPKVKWALYIACILLGFYLLITFSFTFFGTDFRGLNTWGKVKENIIQTENNSLSISNIPKYEFVTGEINNFDKDYDITPVTQKSGTVRIPVFTYHQIAPLPSNPKTRDYYVSPTGFDAQMKYLSDKGYKTLTTKEFYELLKSGVNPKQKSILLTFDDGNYNNYSNAFPILKKYGFVGVFYVPSSRRGINNTQIKEMVDAGMVIEPHGKTHMLLSKITDSGILYDELVNSKLSIESVTGEKVYSFCYPGCEYNGAVKNMLSSNGYAMAFTCGGGIDQKYSNRYSLYRQHVYDDMKHFKSILSGIWYYPAGY